MTSQVNKYKNLNIAHINIRSIIGKINTIKNCILTNKYDIFAVSETWLTDVISDEVVNINGYRLIRRDRGHGRGGGVLLYMRDSIKCSILSDQKTDYSEFLCVSFKINGVKNILSVIYRPPGFTNIDDFFDEFEYNISRNLLVCDCFVCLGDFNIDMSISTSIYRRI